MRPRTWMFLQLAAIATGIYAGVQIFNSITA
ncbi:MAG: hypothetical protein QOH90_973 [Actinomycetota bacterium]|nr:hypothetical protein [Actinomycetota bacterium]